MVTLRERLIAEGKLKPHPEIASLLAKPGPGPEQKKRQAKAVEVQTKQPKAQPAKAVERYYLDESGTFEGEDESLAAGLRVFGPEPGDQELVELLGKALKAWGWPRRPLPPDGVHATKMKDLDRGAFTAFLDALLKGLAHHHAAGRLGVFLVRDQAHVHLKDRNIAHAAVLARGLASDLATTPADLPVRVVAAGRMAAKDGITDTSEALGVVILSRLAEELAVMGAKAPPGVEVAVRHMKGQDWRAPAFAGLFIADVLSNLMLTGKHAFAPQHQVAMGMLLPGCPHVVRRADERRRGRHVFEEAGAAGYLGWLRGPLGPIQPSAEERALLRTARKQAVQPELLVPTLTQLCEAANRQVRVFRNLKAGRRLAEEALELAHVSLESTGGEEVGRFAYQALECLLDVCNHQGDVAGAVGVMRREAELRRQVGLHALVESFEFRNRAAESAVNEFDFRGAGEALDGLRREIEEVGRHFPLGARVATLGRVLSHRAQVHHYLGEDKQALALYAGAGEHYSTPLDREILTQHRVRSFLGMGKGLDAWAGIRSLGVTRELAGLRADDPFLLDLVALAGRFAVEDGPGSKLSWLPRVLLGRPQLLARALGRSTQSGYPGAATAASVARIAAFLGDAARSVESTLWAMQLASRDEVPTMHAITLGAALEGLDNLRQLDATKRSEAAEFFGVAEAMAEVLTREGQPAPLRSHFLPALDTLRRWKGPQAALAEPAILRRLIRRVPFGRVGGFPLVWVEKAAQLERSRRAR